MAVALTKNNVKDEVENSAKPVVIDVFANWCPPCLHMMPTFEEVSDELADRYNFLKLNVDEARELAISYGVTSVPTFIFIKNNELKGKIVGGLSKEDLISKIHELLD
jgi:thioredoxin 1